MKEIVFVFGMLFLLISVVSGEVNNSTSPNILVEFVDITTANVTIDQIANFNTTLYNNGSGNATNYFLNLTLWTSSGSPPGILGVYTANLHNETFNLSASERKNFNVFFLMSYANSPLRGEPTQGIIRGGALYIFHANVTNTTSSNVSISNNRSARFKIAYSSWGGGNFFDYTYQYRVKYANGTELIVQNTSELIAGGQDYASINYYGNVNYLVLVFKLNATKAESLISQGKTLKVVKYNGTMGIWQNMTVGSNGITFLDINLINRLITINTSSFSDWGFIIVDVPAPPPPGPVPQYYGGGGGGAYTPPKLLSIKDYRPFFFSDCIVIYGKNSREIDAILAKKVKDYLYCDRVVREDEEYDWKKYDRDNKNIILIGGVHANELVKQFNENLSYRFVEDRRTWNVWNGKEFVVSEPSLSYIFMQKLIDEQRNQNSYLIEIFNHPVRSGKRVMVLAGLTAAGTEEAVRVITNSSEYNKLTELNYLGGRN